jgi:hypothetical protein
MALSNASCRTCSQQVKDAFKALFALSDSVTIGLRKRLGEGRGSG